MSLERRNPLPAGRYWIDVTDANHEAFRQWTTSNPTRVTVLEEEPGDGVTWFLWRQLQPAKFDQRTFGFPTIAPASVQHATDTAQRPPEVTSINILESFLSNAKTVILLAVGLLIFTKGSKR